MSRNQEVAEEFAESELPDLEELSIDDLTAVDDFLQEKFATLSAAQSFSDEDTAAIVSLAAAIQEVAAEFAFRLDEAEQDEAREAAVAAVATGNGARAAFMAKANAELAAADEEAEAEVEVEPEVVPAEAVAASAAALLPTGLTSNVSKSTKDADVAQNVPTIIAAAGVPGFGVGQGITDLAGAAAAFTALRPKIVSTGRDSDGARESVMRINFGKQSADRTLHDTDIVGNEAKIEALTSSKALVAAGGMCAPCTPLYDLNVLGADTCTPITDSLPTFRAERGCVRFLQAPRFDASTGGPANGSVRVTTAAEDAAGYTTQQPTPGPTLPKPCIRIECGQEITANLDAISRCLTFGNFGSRTYPEQVEAWLKLSLAAQAKVEEEYILDKIKAGSIQITTVQEYSATRSLLGQISRAIASWKSRYRYCGGVRLQALLPFWVKDILRTDLANDNFDGHDWSVSDAQLESWFSARGVNITWYIDTPTTGTSQIFATQVAGPLNPYPAEVQWALFPAATWLYLEGGSIDMGIVRDSTLNSTNDYQVWSEKFLGLVNRGNESYWITSPLCPTGVGPAPVAAITC